MENGIIRTSAMRAKKKEPARVRYSAAYPMGREFGGVFMGSMDSDIYFF